MYYYLSHIGLPFRRIFVNNLKYAIQKTMHALIKSGFRNPKRWIQKNVFTLHEATKVIKALLFDWEKDEIKSVENSLNQKLTSSTA